MNRLSQFAIKLGAENKFEGVRPGWTVRIHQKIKEGEKSRVQAFEGMVIARKHGDEISGTITVRKMTDGIGVDKTFPIHLPTITKVDILRRTNTRRAKLYYLRDKTSKEIRKKIKTEQNGSVSSKKAAAENLSQAQ